MYGKNKESRNLVPCLEFPCHFHSENIFPTFNLVQEQIPNRKQDISFQELRLNKGKAKRGRLGMRVDILKREGFW